mgnify:CR=1 FL=1
MDWAREVDLLERELDRSWASLRLEEHRNRALPELTAPADAEAYAALQDRDATSLMRFLFEQEVLPATPYLEPALLSLPLTREPSRGAAAEAAAAAALDPWVAAPATRDDQPSPPGGTSQSW